MNRLTTLFLALMMGTAVQAQEIEKVDKFPSGYINGVYMAEAKYKTIDGVLYAVGYEGTKDWILVRYPAGSRNDTYTVHPYCRRIARGAFEGAAYLREIYMPETVSYIGDNAFAGCSYNLSGRPCNPTDKGVQIIVYSDYTTQTIIIN